MFDGSESYNSGGELLLDTLISGQETSECSVRRLLQVIATPWGC